LLLMQLGWHIETSFVNFFYKNVYITIVYTNISKKRNN
jgi:hypothetical protein